MKEGKKGGGGGRERKKRGRRKGGRVEGGEGKKGIQCKIQHGVF